MKAFFQQHWRHPINLVLATIFTLINFSKGKVGVAYVGVALVLYFLIRLILVISQEMKK